MSRLPNRTMVMAIGASDLVLGFRPDWRARLWSPLRPRTTEPAWLAMPEAQRFTEQGAIDLFRQALADAPSGAASRMELVVSDFWAHHAVLRGDFRSMQSRELEEIAQAYFTDTFAMEAGGLAIRWNVQKGGRALFASAISRTLQDGLLATAAAAGIKVCCLVPGLPLLLNQVRQKMDGRRSLLVVVAETMLHTVMAEHNRWVAYDTQRLFPGDAAATERLAGIAENLFERSALEAPETCAVYWCGLATEALPAMPRFGSVHQVTAGFLWEGMPCCPA